MSEPQRRLYPGEELEAAHDQVRTALRRAMKPFKRKIDFCVELNARLAKAGEKSITYQAIQYWERMGHFIDARFWRFIEDMSDMDVTRRHLRPDIYGLLDKPRPRAVDRSGRPIAPNPIDPAELEG